MNNLEEKLEKTFQQIDICGQIWLHALAVATRIVDENFPCYQKQIDSAKLPNDKNIRTLARIEMISTVISNLLRLNEVVLT